MDKTIHEKKSSFKKLWLSFSSKSDRVLTFSLLVRLPPRKFVPWFILWKFLEALKKNFGLCPKEAKKQGWLVGQQQKLLLIFHLASFLTFKNEENGRDKSYTLIYLTSLVFLLSFVVCLSLNFSKSWYAYQIYEHQVHMCTRYNMVNIDIF